MTFILHDLSEEQASSLCEENAFFCGNDLKYCLGCFGCWVKTPGNCVLKDRAPNLGKCLSECRRLVLISRCVYGGFSPAVKTALERCISYLLPYFQIINGEMHHKLRYENKISLYAAFYGSELCDDEKETARGLMQANSINLGAELKAVRFFETAEEVRIS